MQIQFKTKKLVKTFNSDKSLQREYGQQQAHAIKTRYARLRAATSLNDFAPPYSGAARCHELTGNKAGIFSMDIKHPYRLLFKPNHDPVPQRPEGGIDWKQITAIEILGIEDTHA